MNIPTGFAQVTPYIFANNVDDYVTFLQVGLGGQEIGRTLTPDGVVANCQIRFGDVSIMVSESSDDFPPSRAALYLYVEDADATVAQAVKLGATINMPVADMPYNDRQGGIVDPSGNIWSISQRLTPEPYHYD